MDANLELIRTRATVRYLAENLDVSDAQTLLHDLKESSAYLERRIAREKSLQQKAGGVILSVVEAKAS